MLWNGGFDKGAYRRAELRAEHGRLHSGQREIVGGAYACAQAWARQSQKWGTTRRGNLYFARESLYSYGPHYLLGVLCKSRHHKGPVALINSESYSVTTTRHQYAAMWEAGGAARLTFSVPHLNPVNHVANHAHLVTQARAHESKMLNRRCAIWNRCYSMRAWQQELGKANLYAKIFDVKGESFEILSDDSLERLKDAIETDNNGATMLGRWF